MAVRSIRGNQELDWLYFCSETDMGISAIDYSALGGGRGTGLTAGLLFQLDAVARACDPSWLSPPVPTDRQVKAAQRQRWYRTALSELSSRHQAAIDCAYQIRDLNGLPPVRNLPSGPRLVSDYGIAAPVVRRVLLDRRVVEAECEDRIREAGQVRAQALRTGSQLDVGAAQAAESAAKQELRAEQAASGAAADRAARLLDDALRAYEAVRRKHRTQAKAELKVCRAAGKARREAHLAELLGEPQSVCYAAEARAIIEERFARVDAENRRKAQEKERSGLGWPADGGGLGNGYDDCFAPEPPDSYPDPEGWQVPEGELV